MHNYNEYIAKLTTQYVQASIKREDKLQKFLEQLKVKNKITGEVHSLRSDFLATARDNYLWLVFQSIYMQNSVGSYSQAIFITVTLPSTYHPYITHKRGKKLKRPIPNKRYNPTLLNGSDRLNKFWRELYKDFKVNRKRVRLHYQKVIEPHKTFVPHMHALVYVPKEHALSFQKHFDRMIKKHYLGKQNDFEVIKNQARSATYLLKYIKKNLDGSNPHHAHMLDGWKKENKIRVYTHSQITIPKFIFQKITRVLQLTPDQDENILEKVENLCDIVINYNEKDETRMQAYTGENAKYFVKVDIEVTSRLVLKDQDIDQALLSAQLTGKFDHITKNAFYSDHEGDFLRFAHDLEGVENALEGGLYFGLYQDDELVDLFAEYTNGLEHREVKMYSVKEFVIEDDQKVYYRKSDFELF